MIDQLAIDGGTPVRPAPLPLIRVSFDEQERRQMQSVLDAGVFCSVMPAATKVKDLSSRSRSARQQARQPSSSRQRI